MAFVRAYLRASTSEQDANRAKADLDRFAEDRGLAIASYYIENESGASLKRPELFRLLADAKAGDLILVEQIDRLSRLNAGDWTKLRAEIASRRLKVVSLDLPTSWLMTGANDRDAFTERMFEAINSMMLDMLAAIARKDYDDRRRRQAQGIANNKEALNKDGQPKYRGKVEDEARNAAIVAMLEAGQSWSNIIAATGCSRSTLSRLRGRARSQ